jgi:hypothetical protein
MQSKCHASLVRAYIGINGKACNHGPIRAYYGQATLQHYIKVPQTDTFHCKTDAIKRTNRLAIQTFVGMILAFF